jgi:hypothetical protein
MILDFKLNNVWTFNQDIKNATEKEIVNGKAFSISKGCKQFIYLKILLTKKSNMVEDNVPMKFLVIASLVKALLKRVLLCTGIKLSI